DSYVMSQGANTIVVQGQPAGNTSNVVVRQAGSSLTPYDLQSMRNLSHALAVSPYTSMNAQVVYGDQNWNTQVIGVGVALQTMQNWQMADGLWFSDSEEADGSPVAVLGDTVYHRLFDVSGTDPIHQQIRIDHQVFRVSGVLYAKGGLG